MSAPSAEKSGSPVATVFRFLARFTLNTMRRLAILGHYLLICWQQQRLRRAWRRLGQRVHLALEDGEVNPMLTEPVKDAVERANKLKRLKDRQYEAIRAIRARISQAPAPETEARPEEGPGEEEE
jgi:hypothetical protein